MKILSFSQTGYPRVIVYQGDTIVLILPSQLKQTNKEFVSLKYFKEQTEILEKQVNIFEKKCLYLDTQINLLNQISSNKDKVIEEQGQMMEIQEKNFEQIRKEDRNRAILIGSFGGVVLFILGVVVGS